MNDNLTSFNREKFGQVLKRALGDRSINQYAMSCGVSATYISKLLRGLVIKRPGYDILVKLADKAFNGVPLSEFLEAADYLQSQIEEPSLKIKYGEDLPEEAQRELKSFADYLREKWKGWKPGDPPR